MPASEFYGLTLGELMDAISGHFEFEQTRLQWSLWGVRKTIYAQLASVGVKDLKEEDIFPLEMDEQLRKERHRNMPMMTFTKEEETN